MDNKDMIIRRYFILSLSALMLAGCAGDEEVNNSSSTDERLPLRLEATLSGNRHVTRAVGSEFETDDVDWRLTELIVNMQFACQRHYFGAMAEAYFDNKLKDASVNVQRKQKTFEGFARLPDEFTNEDVMRCFNLSSEGAARMKIKRLLDDHLIEKLGDGRQTGASKSSYRKTGNIML